MSTARRGPAWSRLREWMGTIDDLSGAARLLDWDRETVMPAGGAHGRGHQVATLHALRHREVVAPGLDDVIDEAAADPDLSEAEIAMIRLARRERERGARVSERLVREIAEATSASVTSWLTHRQSGDFAAFAPALARVVDAVREWGEALEIGDEPYDGLLDLHEPGLRTATLEPMFAALTAQIGELLVNVPDRVPPPLPADRAWPDSLQLALAHEICRMTGFSLETGLVSRSAHPFTTSPHLGDVRFTTKLAPDDPTVNALVTMHEVGHALYAQGHPTEHVRTLVYASPSLGAEESQARFFENHVGRTPQLWRRLHLVLTEWFGSAMNGIGPDDLHDRVTAVARGWCRVDADELTYDLHIALRLSLELALLRRQITVDELPEAWSAGMARLLGVTPADDREGCLQDIHWAWAGFGYFPTDTLGNIYAAQLAEAVETRLGPIGDIVARGETIEITRFLRDRIHRQGSIVPTPELMERATGSPFDLGPYLRRLRVRAADAR